MRAVFVTKKSSGNSCRAAVILPGASPYRRTARWRHARRRTAPAQAGELLSDAGSRLDTVEVQAFEEAFHSFICLTDELFQRETLATKRTAHEGLVAGTRDLQLVIAFRTGQCRLGLPGCKIRHVSSLVCCGTHTMPPLMPGLTVAVNCSFLHSRLPAFLQRSKHRRRGWP